MCIFHFYEYELVIILEVANERRISDNYIHNSFTEFQIEPLALLPGQF